MFTAPLILNTPIEYVNNWGHKAVWDLHIYTFVSLSQPFMFTNLDNSNQGRLSHLWKGCFDNDINLSKCSTWPAVGSMVSKYGSLQLEPEELTSRTIAMQDTVLLCSQVIVICYIHLATTMTGLHHLM